MALGSSSNIQLRQCHWTNSSTIISKPFYLYFRDLKMKKTRKPADPKFNVAEYVSQERKSGGCCGS